MKGNLISIHALLAESDYQMQETMENLYHFYPRSPCGERPRMARYCCEVLKISIHALLAESDASLRCIRRMASEFLSTLSLRRATATAASAAQGGRFLSTLSLRRATYRQFVVWYAEDISIHALLAESDCQGNKFHSNRYGHFYPRSPCGERQISENQYRRTS